MSRKINGSKESMSLKKKIFIAAIIVAAIIVVLVGLLLGVFWLVFSFDRAGQTHRPKMPEWTDKPKAIVKFSNESPQKLIAIPELKWKFATLAPNTTGWCKQVSETLLPLLEEHVQGKISIKTYTGGVVGDDWEMLRKMRVGKLDGACLSALGVTQAIPEMAVLQLPFLIRDYNEVDYLREKMLATFDTLAEKQGYFLIAWIDQDFDQIYSGIQPFSGIEHFPKARFISWYGPTEEAFISLLGGSPVIVNVISIPTALSGRAGPPHGDTLIAPSAWIIGSQSYNNFRYINTTKIRYSPALIIHDLKNFDVNPGMKELKKLILANRSEYTKKICAGIREDNQKGIDALIKYGIKKIEFSPEALIEIKKRTRPIWDQMAGKLYPKEMLDQVLFYLDECRSLQKQS